MIGIIRSVWCCLILGGLLFSTCYGQDVKQRKFVEADQLTITGKAFTTSVPYHRVDTATVNGMTGAENQQARSSAGLAILFTTNSTFIDVHANYKWEHQKDNMTGIASAGFDLYIKKGDKWVHAANGVSRVRDSIFTLIADMDKSLKECLLYLPIYSELKFLKIGVDVNASLNPLSNPFKRKTVFFGSSFTQGISASRPGMSYPLQVQRKLNLDVCNLGFSGNAKLQPYFAKMLAALDTEVLVLDAFSNPNEKMIRERFLPFLEIVMKKHNNIPVVFVETIDRINSNFNLRISEAENKKRKAAQELMDKAMKKYKNLYFVKNPLPLEINEDTSADGVHPSDLGYFRWAETLTNKLKEIIK